MIYTFYSYKGGVGRSMALANVAELLYRSGLKVLMVDWDLEAPGLERFFSLPSDQAAGKPGIIDMLLDYKKQMAEKPFDTKSSHKGYLSKEVNSYLVNVYPEHRSDGRLWLFPAGQRSKEHLAEYANAVLNFDWQDFYENWEGELFFEWLRRQFEQVADVVLIDSRTGVTEMGGVCSYQLADNVIMFCSPNQQSIDGTYEMAQSLSNPDVLTLRRQRPLNLLIIPSRIERAESELLDDFQQEFTSKFEKFVPHEKGISIVQLWQVSIPYIPRYAFVEKVAVTERDRASSKDMTLAYFKLVQIMLLLAPSELSERIHPQLPDSEITRKLRVFVAFQADAANERKKVDSVVAKLNRQFFGTSIAIEVVDWGQTVVNSNNPDKVIFDQVKPTSWDVFIGILWKNFDTSSTSREQFRIRENNQSVAIASPEQIEYALEPIKYLDRPESGSALLDSALKASRAREFEESVKRCTELYDWGLNQSNTYIQGLAQFCLGSIHFALGDPSDNWTRAASCFARSAKLFHASFDTESTRNEGIAELALGRLRERQCLETGGNYWSEAIAAFEKAKRLFSDKPDVLFSIAEDSLERVTASYASQNMSPANVREEFLTAYRLWKQFGRPQFTIYHCVPQADQMQVEIDQSDAAKEFLKELGIDYGENSDTYKPFDTIETFENLLSDQLSKLLSDYTAQSVEQRSNLTPRGPRGNYAITVVSYREETKRSFPRPSLATLMLLAVGLCILGIPITLRLVEDTTARITVIVLFFLSILGFLVVFAMLKFQVNIPSGYVGVLLGKGKPRLVEGTFWQLPRGEALYDVIPLGRREYRCQVEFSERRGAHPIMLQEIRIQYNVTKDQLDRSLKQLPSLPKRPQCQHPLIDFWESEIADHIQRYFEDLPPDELAMTLDDPTKHEQAILNMLNISGDKYSWGIDITDREEGVQLGHYRIEK